ncbi:ATP-binding protein [Aliikangiella sp. IMCC44359]|uniref:ATP-binding protein n=1 Tax=Aliikangiella sp. IMCC44359 TaxID=3459125 RepID=UPI00403B2FC0
MLDNIQSNACALPEQINTHANIVNINTLHQELDWLEQVINQVICSYLKQQGHERNWFDIPLPVLDKSSIYADFIECFSLNIYERLVVALAMAPHFKPELLDIFFGLNALYDRNFTEFGGVTNKAFSGFLPTGQTVKFLISSNNPEWFNIAMELLEPTHVLAIEQVISLNSSDSQLPISSGIVSLSEQWLHYFMTGKKVRPELSHDFPAQPITTPLNWADLILEHSVMKQINEIKSWLIHGETLMNQWGLNKKVKQGYRTLFYGPPGTGKTLTASLLAKSTEREIYRVDLSMIVSKYIGETEKNLSRVFDVASHKDWILFFDEADALFGQRTEATTSNDRHANQQTGYLLQRIEDFPGVVILATNLKSNIDEAFTRRFQSMIHFAMPTESLRYQLWQQAFQGVCELDDSIDLSKIAKDYELAGGAIINVLRHCALAAISRGDRCVKNQDLMIGIRREFKKDNRTVRIL